MSRRSAFLLVLILAAVLRTVGVNWAGDHEPHPDERRIAYALEEITLRPLNLNPHFFAYGSFPIYLQKVWTSAASTLHLAGDDYHGRVRAARVLSAIVGIGMVACLFVLGARLYGESTGLLAALLLAVCVLPIQHGHFITVDLYQAAFALVVLERLTRFVESGERRAFWTAAALTGLTFATKASSVPLLLPLLVAPFLRPRDETGRIPFASTVWLVAAGCVLVAFFFAIGEPYALLDHEAFLHDVREQADMVRHAGGPVYTIQYVGSRPYVDDLRQAFTWGMGPALGACALFGMFAALLRGARSRQPAEIVLLSFFVPYLLITGSFPVKFMRYLLPLYPLWCLWAARLLTGGTSDVRAWRRAAVAVVVAATALYALAFETIYLRPHVWITASRWFYREIPDGATVLKPHWEEGLPFDVDGQEARRYKLRELPLYEPDTDQKMATLADDLAAGDVLVFPSKRLYGSITNVPERYPRTVRFFELLFAGELGYRLDRVFASRPQLFGFELDDDAADESFSVYDHPKTLIFRKIESLPASEVLSRLRSWVPHVPISRAAMLEAESDKPPAPEERSVGGVQSSAIALTLWTAALWGLWLCGSRLLAAWMPEMSGMAAGGLAAPLAYLLFVYACWLTASLGWAPFGVALCSGVAALLAVLVSRRRAAEGSAAGLAVLIVAFLFFAAIRAWNPEIYWGEKPMDFSFLNAIDRTKTLPPPEPWMSGYAINYPYLGHFGVVALGKLLHVPPALSFNLGIAMFGAMTAAAAFGVGAALSERLWGGFLAATLVAFAGNLDGPREFWARRVMNFDYFWATSRVIPNTINEFPLWSFLFADLHAHVMTLPLSVLFLGLTANWLCQPRPRRLARLLLIALTLGAIATTSTWSLPVYAGAVIGLALVAAIAERRPTRLLFPPFVVLLSYAFFLPYWRQFTSPPRNWGWEVEMAPLRDVLLIFGGFVLVTLLALADRAQRRDRSRFVRWLFVAILLVVAWRSTRFGFTFLGIACLAAALGEERPAARVSFALAAGAGLLGAAADTVFLWDRMNTIFKLYLESWIFLALASSFWLASGRAAAAGGRVWRASRRIALAAVVAASAFTAFSDVVGTLRTQHINGPRPTLDGMAYLRVSRPAEGLAYRWLNDTISGSPVLLEAQGPSYQDFGRVSMNTGLPTVLGWDYHLMQRAHSTLDIAERKQAVEAIYASLDRAEVARLLARYHVAMVYLGFLERRTYPAEGIAKFAAWKDLFQPIYQNPAVQIYAVPANFRWSETTPIVEAPPAERAESEHAGPERPRIPDALGTLREPRGLAVDAKGNVWVADFGNARIHEFDASLKPLRAFGTRGDQAGEFDDPCGVAVGRDGLLYVADTWNHRIQVFDANGKYVREWTAEFFGPRGITVGPDGSIYVTDTGNGRVAKFDPDGKLLARFGKKGSGVGELDEPMGIAVSKQGDVLVVDSHNARVVVFSPDGAVRMSWPVPAWKEQAFREPGIALLRDGRVAVAAPARDAIEFYDTRGEPVGERKLDKDMAPVGLAAAADGSLLVSGLHSTRIVRLEKP
jgi:YYY domain-containing protein